MARIVKKFGGTSVGDLDRMRNAAARVKATLEAGDEVAVVLSAMAGTTDQLIDYCSQASPLHDAREYDTVVSAGEQISIGLFSIVLQEMGVPARSWLGWQLPVRTSGTHGAALIEEIDTEALRQRMRQGQVPVIAGFQGIGPDGRITTLGRGGSDTSAVALAAALGANRCDIYTDVDGVYTTDPRVVSQARKIDRITYEEMLEMASLGAKVLQTRSVALAMRNNVRIQVLSSFESIPGTIVVGEDEIMEQNIVTGITPSEQEAKITVYAVEDRPGAVAAIFTPLAAAGINVDMIVQTVAGGEHLTNVTFTVPEADLKRTVATLEKVKAEISFNHLEYDTNVVKISVIGVGMRSHTGVANTMFVTLAEKGINIQAISTSEIKISVLIASEYMELAMRALHSAYELDEKAAQA